MNESEFFKEYCTFVNSVTSEPSRDDEVLRAKITELSELLNGNYARMDTAVAGIAGEAGEIADLWKKLKFHGKPFNEENRSNMIKELGDMFWYLAQASMALGIPMEEIIRGNVEKLKQRHPHGFSGAYMDRKKETA